MKKNERTSIARAKYIQDTINNKKVGEKVENLVNEIAEKLFLSPFTVWKDLKKDIPKDQSGKI